jgi:hypothetical protein
MRKCTSCQFSKAVEEFHPSRTCRDGLMTHCKECHRTLVNENSRKKRLEDPNYHSHRGIKSRYKMPSDRYDKGQKGSCAICGISGVKLYVDHDHSCCPGERTCGKCVRDFLCHKCNIAVGFLEDTSIAEGLLSYIKKWG